MFDVQCVAPFEKRFTEVMKSKSRCKHSSSVTNKRYSRIKFRVRLGNHNGLFREFHRLFNQ